MKTNPLSAIILISVLCLTIIFLYTCSVVRDLTNVVEGVNVRIVDIEKDLNSRVSDKTLNDVRDTVLQLKSDVQANGKKGSVVLIKLDELIKEIFKR